MSQFTLIPIGSCIKLIKVTAHKEETVESAFPFFPSKIIYDESGNDTEKRFLLS